jgi:hypothetical protein
MVTRIFTTLEIDAYPFVSFESEVPLMIQVLRYLKVKRFVGIFRG